MAAIHCPRNAPSLPRVIRAQRRFLMRERCYISQHCAQYPSEPQSIGLLGSSSLEYLHGMRFRVEHVLFQNVNLRVGILQ
jgi:hypothetical protein